MGTEISLIERVEYDRRKAYDRTDKGKTRYREYDRRSADAKYLAKEFVAWDGEGGNEDDGSHTYFLLANSDGASLSHRHGLSTESVLEMFLSARSGVIHIGYGLGYDINMILRDLDRDTLQTLYETGKAQWHGYYIEWRGSKSFAVRRGDRRFLLYDVLPFFQRPFVAACDEYFGATNELWNGMRETVVREKARRGTFEWADINGVSEYNGYELALLVALANELRSRLHRVGIKVSRWDGPGAIAAALYKKYETKSYQGAIPHGAAKAGRFAYAGGRFEIIRKGHSVERCYQYDIRSAYPSAARYLPCLAHGEWTHKTISDGIIRTTVPFGVYRIEIVEPPTASITDPQPLWMRNHDGTVYFSEFSHGWYWTPEAELALELGGATIHEAWEWNPTCDHEPFGFVEALYNKRAALKKAGDGAHVGLKLGLNSLYGKLAQQIGWGYDKDGNLRLPPYHSLEWAGFITSHCRSQVYRAAMLAPHDIIAFETDAVFSRLPLPLPLGDRLGEWDATEYESLTYLKSGMYFGTLSKTCNGKPQKDGGKEVEKTRGINKGTISRAEMIVALQAEQTGEEEVYLQAEQTRFVGLGQALHQDFAKWRRWYTDPRRISVALSGKRVDLLSNEEAYRHLNDGWVETQEAYADTTFSHEYPVAWINPNPEMASPDGLDIGEFRLFDTHDVVIP